jgi:intein/homing endonuclease
MATHSISKRLVFADKNSQRLFLLKAKADLILTWKEVALLSGVTVKTITDWARGKFNMSANAAHILSKKSHILLPASSRTQPWGNHLKTIGSLGGKAVYEKYGHIGGDLPQRTQKWLNWFNTKGKALTHLKRKDILIPNKNTALAEFVGIMMGDGGISKRQICITLNAVDDYAYSLFVRRLLFNLFGVNPSVRKRKGACAIDIYISRTNLVDACEKIGLKIGNKIKQGLDIPPWVRNSPQFTRACIRGLIDTDGCVFTHTYTVKGKLYKYKKMNFTTASRPLLISMHALLKKNGLHPRISYPKRIYLDSMHDMKRYFKIIGSHNPKHLRKYRV